MPVSNPPADVHARIRELLDVPRSDEALRVALEDLAYPPWSPAFCSLYGPDLYSRNPNLFRPFLRQQLDAFSIDPEGRRYDPWRGPEASALMKWLDAADAADDVEMFLALYLWRAQSLPPDERVVQWRRELARRYVAADSDAGRAVVLEKMNTELPLDQATAVTLYEVDSRNSPSFIRRHMASIAGAPGAYWAELSSLARKKKDQEFFFAIYRRTVEADQWARDVELLADRLEPANELVAELERRDPDVSRRNACSVLYALLKKRGDDVVPYASYVLERVGAGLVAEPARHTDLIRLADERGWLELWTRLLVASGRDAEVDREVRRLVEDQRREEEELLRRLDMIARIGWGRAGDPRSRLTLSDETAVKTYARFPLLLRNVFRRRLGLGTHGYVRLLNVVVSGQDEVLTDYLASLVVVVDMQSEWARREVAPMVDVLCGVYGALTATPEVFAERAARVLGFAPAGAVPAPGYAPIATGNQLTSLLLDAPLARFLASPAAIRDLLESPETYAQQLGFRILALDELQARTIAADNLDLLKAALLRRMPRRVRLTAFRAMDNVSQELVSATKIVAAVRIACELPDRGYPKDHLIALLGRVLHRHPSLRSPEESSFNEGVDA